MSEQAQKILFLDKSDRPVRVSQEDFAEASEEMDPAFEFRDTGGGLHFVRRQDYQAAEKSGLKPHVLWESERNANDVYKESLKKTPYKPTTNEDSPFLDRAKDYVNRGGAALEAPLRGFANVTTAGFADNVSGAVGAGRHIYDEFSKPKSERDLSMQSIGDAYSAKKDEYQVNDDQIYNDHPITYGTGAVAGAVAPMVGGLGAINAARGGAGLIEKTSPMVAEGMVNGMGAGTDYDPNHERDTLQNTLMSGVMSGVVGGSLAQLSGPAQSAGRNLSDRAEINAYRSAGPLKADVNKIWAGRKNATNKQKFDEMHNIGRTMLNEKIVPFFADKGGDEISGRLSNRLNEFSEKQDNFIRNLDILNKGGVDPKLIYQKLQSEINDKTGPSVGMLDSVNAVQAELDLLKATAPKKQVSYPINLGKRQVLGEYSFDDAVNLKRRYDQSGKYQSTMMGSAKADAAKSARSAVMNSIDESVAKITDAPNAQAYKDDRMVAKRLMDAQRAIESNSQRYNVNKPISLTDTIGAAPFIASGNPLGAAGLVVGKRFYENYRDSFLANLQNTIGKGLQKYGRQDIFDKISKIVGPDVARSLLQSVDNNPNSEEN